MNPQHPDLESDALPLELLACMLKCVRAVSLNNTAGIKYNILFRFFMSSMLSAKSAVFTELKFVRRRSFVFCCGVIPSFAFTTR